MEDKINISNILKKIAGVLFQIGYGFVNAGIYIILAFGALSSMLLLAKLYPEMFLKIAIPFETILKLIINAAIFFVSMAITVAIFYLVVKYVLDPISEKQRIARKKREEEIENRIAEQIVNKMRNKK